MLVHMCVQLLTNNLHKSFVDSDQILIQHISFLSLSIKSMLFEQVHSVSHVGVKVIAEQCKSDAVCSSTQHTTWPTNLNPNCLTMGATP